MYAQERPEGDELRIACDPTMLNAEGYAFRHSSEASVCLAVAEFITLESMCCPFFEFGLEVERDGGSLWLRITGGEDARRVLREELEAAAAGV